MLNIKRLTIAALAIAAAATFATSSPADTEHGQNVSYFTLANGLELVVIPDRRTPVVTHMIWYKVGSADEPIGKSGGTNTMKIVRVGEHRS